MATNTLATLKPLCAAFHKKTAGDLTVNSVDLFLVAANNARRKAELRHNFEFSRVKGTLSIDGTSGASLADVVLDEGVPGSILATATTLPNSFDGTYLRGGTFNDKPVYFLFSTTAATSTVLFYQTIGTDGWEITRLQDFPDHAIAAGKYFLASTADTPKNLTLVGDGLLGDMSLTAVSSFRAFKEVVAASRLRDDGSDSPLDFTRHDIAMEAERTELEFCDDNRGAWRYPSDAQIEARTGHPALVQRGQRLHIYPTDTEISDPIDIVLYGYGWLADYESGDLTDTTPSDFLLEHGSEFMQWAIICELNFYFKTFVQREEGNLSAPEQAKEMAWRELFVWDTYQVDSNLTRSR